MLNINIRCPKCHWGDTFGVYETPESLLQVIDWIKGMLESSLCPKCDIELEVEYDY